VPVESLVPADCVYGQCAGFVQYRLEMFDFCRCRR